MGEKENQIVWLVSRPPFSTLYRPGQLSNLIKPMELIKRTELGFRLVEAGYKSGRFFHENNYSIFDSEQEALGYLLQEADKATRQLCHRMDAFTSLTNEIKNSIVKGNNNG